MLEHLRIAKYRFTLQAGERGLELPPWKASTFRGGFGHVFKRLACMHPGQDCGACSASSYCAYTYVFETSPEQEGAFMGKYDQVPRPYILEVPSDKQTHYDPGEFIKVDLLLFGKAIHYAPLFVTTFKELGREGIGKGRNPYLLVHVENISPLQAAGKTIYTVGNDSVQHQPVVISGQELLSLAASNSSSDKMMLFFDTPLRLKWQGSYTDNPEFHIVLRSILRRVTGILQFHHGLEAQRDYRELLERARQIKLVRRETRWVDYSRYSARQDDKMKLGGIMGWAQYEGDLTEFMPWLKVAEFVHCGKNAVFDLGRVRVYG